MSRRTNGVIDKTMAGINVSSVSSTTMFQGAELPGADPPGKRPGSDKSGAARGCAQSGAAVATSKTKSNRRRPIELRRERISWLLRILRPGRIRPAAVPEG